jgi:hypothetical protein
MQESLEFLANTDEPEAKLYAKVERDKKAMEATFKACCQLAPKDRKTVAQREDYAYNHESYKTREAAWITSLAQHRTMKNQRATCNSNIEVWRSLNAARNKGQMV